MAKDLGDAIGTVVGKVARETAQNMMESARKSKNGRVPGLAGIALGAGLAAAAPLAVKGAKRATRGLADGADALENPLKKAGDKVTGAASDVVDKKVKDVGGPAGIAKEAGKKLIPGAGDDDGGGGGKNEAPGVGKGRRMPIQQAVDVPVPVSVAYNEFTQFEEWPNFMHRVTSVSQEDETHISFKSKIWGVSKEFEAEIEDQRPDERIQWHVTQGLSHTGVATFHELAPRLTRIEVNVDVEPGSLIEKFARGARHVKRAIRADLHRFKAQVMMNEEESGAWRGTIEDGDVTSSEGDEKEASQSGGGSGSRRASGSRAQAASSSGGRSRSSGSSSSGRSRSSGSSSGGRSRSSGSSSGGRSRSSGSSSGGRSRSSGSSSSGRSRPTSKSSGSSSSGKRTTNRSRSSKSSNGGDPSRSSSSSRQKRGSRS
jgi:uncharacterized membrane protein